MKRRYSFVLLVAALIGVTMAASVIQRRIPSSGTIYIVSLGVDVFWDANCTEVVSAISWGTLRPSDAASKEVYVKNGGNAAIVLSLYIEEWSPIEAGDYITVIWNLENTTLLAGDVTRGQITLNVSSGIEGIETFAMEIVIMGVER